MALNGGSEVFDFAQEERVNVVVFVVAVQQDLSGSCDGDGVVCNDNIIICLKFQQEFVCPGGVSFGQFLTFGLVVGQAAGAAEIDQRYGFPVAGIFIIRAVEGQSAELGYIFRGNRVVIAILRQGYAAEVYFAATVDAVDIPIDHEFQEFSGDFFAVGNDIEVQNGNPQGLADVNCLANDRQVQRGFTAGEQDAVDRVDLRQERRYHCRVHVLVLGVAAQAMCTVHVTAAGDFQSQTVDVNFFGHDNFPF